MIDGENEGNDSKMADVVKTVLLIKNWVTGKADKDTNVTRLEDDFVMLGFFNSLQQANHSSLEVFTHTNSNNSNKLIRKIRKLFTSLWNFSIDDTESFFYYQSFIVTLACLFNLISIPLTIFTEFQDNYYLSWLIGSWITDFLNVLDIFFLSRREYLEDGVRITTPKLMMKNYCKSKYFVVDLISVFPTDFILLGFPNFGFYRLNRLFKAHRISDFLERTEIKTNFPHLFRLIRLIIICIVIFHWNGCFYFIVSIVFDYKNAHIDDWIFSFDKIFDVPHPTCDARWENNNCKSPIDFRTRKYNLEKYHSFYRNKTTFVKFSNLTKKYSLSFYWSALTLTTLGENPPPNNSFQSLFEIVDTLIGLIIIAVIVGDVGAMVTSMNMMRSQFEEKLDGCKTYMKFRSVNIVLQKKIIQWFEYGWKAGSAKIDESTIMECLPPRLRGQLAVHIHMDTLRKVLLFQDCEPGLLYELVLKLQLQIFSPGDVVCRKGDIGKELYIIKKGSLQVVSEDLKTVFVTLSEGKVFGELSVLNIKGNKNGNRRTATILSVGFSDCYVLTKSDLWEVLREYPDAKRSLMEKGKFILRKDNLLVEKDAVEEDTVEDSDLDESPNLEQRLAKIARDVEKSRNQLKKAGFDFANSSAKMKQRMTVLEQRYVTHSKFLRKQRIELLKKTRPKVNW